MNNDITFIQIKPNSDKIINSKLIDSTQKLLNNNQLNAWNNDVEDLLDDITNYVKVIKTDSPIKYIVDFFKDQVTELNNLNQYYDIIPFDVCLKDNKYSIMLTNTIINTPSYIQKLSEDNQKKFFNLTASNLTKFYSNSKAIFGDVFIIKISKTYYDMFLKGVNNTGDIYYDFKPFNLIESIASVYYVKIYSSQTNSLINYSREILDGFIRNQKYNIILSNILEIQHQDMKLYIKFSDCLPDSCNYIMSMVGKQSNYMDFYLVNLDDDDMIKIRSQK